MAKICGVCGEVKEKFCQRCSTMPHYEQDENLQPVLVEIGKVCTDCCLDGLLDDTDFYKSISERRKRNRRANEDVQAG